MERSLRKKKKINYEEEEIDDNEYLNPNYEKEKEERNKILLELTKKIKIDKDAKTLKCFYTKGDVRLLSIVDMGFIAQNWEELKGNEKAPPFVLRFTVNGVDCFFRTSYGMDIGFAPLSIYEGDVYCATTNRTYKFIFKELDDLIAGNKTLRTLVGKAICAVRDSGGVSWKAKINLSETELFELCGLIGELGAILALDLVRAEKQRDNAQKHQNSLVLGAGKFIKFLDDYIGMKAAPLRDSDSYK